MKPLEIFTFLILLLTLNLVSSNTNNPKATSHLDAAGAQACHLTTLSNTAAPLNEEAYVCGPIYKSPFWSNSTDTLCSLYNPQ